MRNLLIIGVLAAVALPCFAQPVTDAFTGTDGTDLSTYNPSWITTVNGYQLYNNELANKNTGAWAFARRTETLDAAQYAQAKITRVYEYDSQIGPAVRMHASTATCYSATWNNNTTLTLRKWVSGTPTTLGTYTGVTLADTVRIEASSTSITVKQNGTTRIGPITDSAIASGSAGVAGWNGISDPSRPNRLDDFEAGNLAGGAVSRRRIIE